MTPVSAFPTGVTAAPLPRSAVPQAPAGKSPGPAQAGPDNLSEGDRKLVDKLRARDQEVRAHEQAHKNVGGQYAGAISYEYQKGPDGKQYAVGGEVPIDASEIPGDPEATIEKMRIVKAAALAPAEPSAQDRKVAALADAQMMKAQAELNAGGGKDSEKDAARPGETLSGSLSQQLAEMRQAAHASNDEASASPSSDLAAYANNAYRHQAPLLNEMIA